MHFSIQILFLKLKTGNTFHKLYQILIHRILKKSTNKAFCFSYSVANSISFYQSATREFDWACTFLHIYFQDPEATWQKRAFFFPFFFIYLWTFFLQFMEDKNDGIINKLWFDCKYINWESLGGEKVRDTRLKEVLVVSLGIHYTNGESIIIFLASRKGQRTEYG